MMQIRDRVSEITDLVGRVRSARQDLDKQQPGGSKADQATIRERLQAIEGALTRLPGPNPNSFPPKALNDRFGSLSGAVAQADARPTSQMYAVFEELSKSVAEQSRRFDEISKNVTP